MDPEPSKKRKRGKRASRPGKNARDAMKRLALEDATASTNPPGQVSNATSAATADQQAGMSENQSASAALNDEDPHYLNQLVDSASLTEVTELADPAVMVEDKFYLDQLADSASLTEVTEPADPTVVDQFYLDQVVDEGDFLTEPAPSRNDHLSLKIADASQPVIESANVETRAEVMDSIEDPDAEHYLAQLANASESETPGQ